MEIIRTLLGILLYPIDQELTAILSDRIDVVCTEDYDSLEASRINDYDLYISYADKWKDAITASRPLDFFLL